MNGREPYVPDVQRWIDYYVKQAEEYKGRGLLRTHYKGRRLVQEEKKEEALPVTLVAPTQQIVEQAKSEQAREEKKAIRGGRVRGNVKPIRGSRSTVLQKPIRGNRPKTLKKSIRGTKKTVKRTKKKVIQQIRDDVFGKR
jgi:hypothetical protein